MLLINFIMNFLLFKLNYYILLIIELKLYSYFINKLLDIFVRLKLNQIFLENHF